MNIDVKELSRIAMKPGEVLLITLERHPRPEQCDALRKAMANVLPDVKVIITGPDATFQAISPQQAA